MKADRDNKYFVELVLKHCNRIADFTKRFNGSRETLLLDSAYEECVTMSILQIGENISKMSMDFLKTYPGQPWCEIVRARHKLTHHYDEIDVDFVWGMVQDDIPKLKEYCEYILEDLNGASKE